MKSFGPDVKPDKKAIKIKANATRRSADVLVAVEFRRYFPGPLGPQYHTGLCFFDSGGNRVVNYPKQHSTNCTAKHQATNRVFKPMVRILKNMRGRLVERGLVADGSAPSYFLEGLLYNVPNEKFDGSYGDSFVAAVNWILKADRTKLVCANTRHYLVRDSVAICWPCANCNDFLNAAVKLWNEWS